MGIWDWIGWGVVLIWVLLVWPAWYGLFRLAPVGRFTPVPADDPKQPMVSIIVPARDEAAAIEAALTRMLALDYPNYEVIAIDDRSTDGTGEITDRIAAADSRCRVIHVTELPAGWLGKNHANWLGAKAARGELLLFTDGDVFFEPPVLRHAVAAMSARGLDHLVLFSEMIKGGFWESVLMNFFLFVFAVATQFSLARFRWAKSAYVGVGAFNLVRRAAYDAFGGHERLRMEVADDVQLGKLVKQAGFIHEALLGAPLVRVKWQTGVGGIIRGLEKNAFAGARYSVRFALVGIAAQPLMLLLPLVLAVTGPACLPWATVVAITWASNLMVALVNRYNPLVTLFYPIAAVLLAYTVGRSMVITLRNGGVTWRGTFYPLDELRRGMV